MSLNDIHHRVEVEPYSWPRKANHSWFTRFIGNLAEYLSECSELRCMQEDQYAEQTTLKISVQDVAASPGNEESVINIRPRYAGDSRQENAQDGPRVDAFDFDRVFYAGKDGVVTLKGNEE